MEQPIVKSIDATCPNCNTEMEVELPEGLVYRDPNINMEEWHKLDRLSAKVHENEYVLGELYSFRLEIANSWRNKKAWKLLNGRILGLECEERKLKDEQYQLYNKLNPPVGEYSTKIP